MATDENERRKGRRMVLTKRRKTKERMLSEREGRLTKKNDFIASLGSTAGGNTARPPARCTKEKNEARIIRKSREKRK